MSAALRLTADSRGPDDLERTRVGRMAGSPDRAYATKLYRNIDEALADVPAQTLAWARRVLYRLSREGTARRLAEIGPLPVFEVRH